MISVLVGVTAVNSCLLSHKAMVHEVIQAATAPAAVNVHSDLVAGGVMGWDTSKLTRKSYIANLLVGGWQMSCTVDRRGNEAS